MTAADRVRLRAVVAHRNSAGCKRFLAYYIQGATVVLEGA